MSNLDFPEIDAPAAAVPAAVTPATPQALTVKQAVLALFGPMERDLRALSERYRDVAFDVSTPKGLKAAKDARHDMRENGRYAVQRVRDQAKKALNDGKAAAELEAERLIGVVKPREDEIDHLIEQREKELEAEREREAARKQKHLDAIAQIRCYASEAQAKAPSAAGLEVGIGYVDALDVSEARFEEFADGAAVAKAETLQVLRTLHARALENERAQAEAERSRRVFKAIAEIQAHGTACLGQPSSAIRERIALMESTVYSEELGDAVVQAHEAQLAQLRQMLTMTEQSEQLLEAARQREAQERAAALAAAEQNAPADEGNVPWPAAAGAYASSEAEAAEASPSGAEGTGLAEQRPEFPDFDGSIETSEREAVDPGPRLIYAVPDQELDLQQLLGDILEHLKFEAQAWDGSRFPSQPKPSPKWWATMKGGNVVLQRRVAEALSEIL
jgi:hypothetical protein